jgi:hypothetical protein
MTLGEVGGYLSMDQNLSEQLVKVRLDGAAVTQ